VTKESLSLIGIRLVAIYLIASGVVLLPNLAQLWVGPADSDMVIGYVIVVVSPLVIGVALYAVSLRISNTVCNGLGASEPRPELGADELHGIALSVAGLLIVATSLPDLVAIVVQIRQASEWNDRQVEYLSNPRLVSELVVLAFGVSMFSGARFWIRLYRRFRAFGVRDA
jgi:hypothetical protein